ncbi:unnamed protein product [Schistocephalus solidus]|uniref:Uncharacterized protein n=1 Tax=Schistocephalus solidus TaxID=70667 RepID=A0A183T3I0_SCHSO|nr:unnamed protein product [Schistocephalus solidus]
MPALSTHLPRVNQPGRTSSEAMQQQTENSHFYVKFCQLSFRPPTFTPDTNFTTPTLIETTSQYSSHVTSTTVTAAATTTSSDADTLLTCLYYDRTFISRIGRVGHL